MIENNCIHFLDLSLYRYIGQFVNHSRYHSELLLIYITSIMSHTMLINLGKKVKKKYMECFKTNRQMNILLEQREI